MSFCVHAYIQHLTPPLLSQRKTSLRATVVSMVTGRVEVREEVERTGEEKGRWEMLADTRRLLLALENGLRAFCEAVGVFVSHRLIRPSVLPSLSSGGEVLWSGRYLCERVCSGNISLIKFLLPNPSSVSSIPSDPHTHARARRDPLLIFLADTSLSGRSLCHHGNPASPRFGAHSASEEHVDELPGSHQWLLVCKQTHTWCTAAEM